MIASDIAKEAFEGDGISLVISDRKKHCDALKAILKHVHHIDAVLFTGDLTIEQRQDVVDQMKKGAIKVLIATGQLIGEGFDNKYLTRLFLTTPVKFSGRLLQYMGRVLRPGPNKKKAKIYDYVDVKVDVLRASANARQKVYHR